MSVGTALPRMSFGRALREALPLAVGAGVLFVGAAAFRWADASGPGRLPIWVLSLGLGVIALGGAVALLVLRPSAGRSFRAPPHPFVEPTREIVVASQVELAEPVVPEEPDRGVEPPRPTEPLGEPRASFAARVEPTPSSVSERVDQVLSAIPEALRRRPSESAPAAAAGSPVAEPAPSTLPDQPESELSALVPALSGEAPPAPPGPAVCATCGKVLSPREAWRRCRKCDRPLCAKDLTDSVRRLGAGYCRSCAATLA